MRCPRGAPLRYARVAVDCSSRARRAVAARRAASAAVVLSTAYPLLHTRTAWLRRCGARRAAHANCHNLTQHVAAAHGQRLGSIMKVKIRDDLDWRAARRPGTMAVTAVMLATVSLP